MLSYEWQELEKKGDDTSPLVLLVQYGPGKAKSLVDRLLGLYLGERLVVNGFTAIRPWAVTDDMKSSMIEKFTRSW